MNIKKAVLKVFSVNAFQLVSSLVVGFFVPAILSIDGYADLKTYALYMSYAGLFHFGFLDGIYIKYGGKKYNEINKKALKSEHNFLILMECIVSICIFILSLITKKVTMFIFAISIIPYMLSSFFQMIFQATGEFKKYSRIMYIYTFVYMVTNVFLAFILKNTNYIYYCLTTYIANIAEVIFVEIKFLKENKRIKPEYDKKNIITNFKVGILVMVGNLAVIGFFGIDKWFVKLFLTTEDFAYYSFAVSMLNVINILIKAISITFYSYLFENNTEKNINKLKNYLMIIGGGASLAFFVLSFIVNTFISKYKPALNIVSITFSTFPYMILINSLYVNLYKVNKDEKKYFKVVVSMFILAIVYNIIAIIIFKNTISIAIATVLTLITWVIYSSNDLKKVNWSYGMYGYLFSLTIFFIAFSTNFSWLKGGICYLVAYILLTCIFEKDTLKDMGQMIKKEMSKRRKTKVKNS